MVRRNGVNLFYQAVPLRLACCDIRKVRPLRRALNNLDAWITGLRRDQWASRANIRKVELDHDHGGLMKVNPLADWTEEEVQDYLRENDVPMHPLYAKGFAHHLLRPLHPRRRPRGGRPQRALVVGGERPQGVRDALLDRDRGLRARAGGHPGRSPFSRGVQRATPAGAGA